jgi:hypothetical protein
MHFFNLRYALLMDCLIVELEPQEMLGSVMTVCCRC